MTPRPSSPHTPPCPIPIPDDNRSVVRSGQGRERLAPALFMARTVGLFAWRPEAVGRGAADRRPWCREFLARAGEGDRFPKPFQDPPFSRLLDEHPRLQLRV